MRESSSKTRSKRRRARDESTYCLPGHGEDAEELPMELLDVNTGGGRIATDESVEQGEEILLIIRAPELDAPVEIEGRVPWCRRAKASDFRYQVGVDFYSAKADHMEDLKKLPVFFDLRRIEPNEDLAELMPKSVAMRLRLLPLEYDKENDVIHVATSFWHPEETLEALRQQFDADVELHYAPTRDVVRAIRFFYGTVTERAPGESEATAFMEKMLEEAHELRATDIHVQPGDPCQVRYRVDGMLVMGPALESKLYDGLVNHIKVQANLDIAERRDALDGHFEWETPAGEHRDVRVETIPTVRAEHVSLRLFGPGDRPEVLPKLGMTDAQLGQMRQFLRHSGGLLILAGPTGAGKTTTLYACLRDMNRTDRHIITMEDPVEHRFENVTQIELHGRTKMVVSNILKSVLRHDPDTLVMGEIRDEETLHLTMQSALSGALTLAGMHSEEAAAAPVRLLDMGAPPYILAANLALVVAQRLVRLLCTQCRQKTELPEEEAAMLGLEPGIEVYRPGACGNCNYTGYRGRTGLFELMPVSEEIQNLILQEATTKAFRQAARSAGMQTMADCGAELVRRGKTSAAEVARVVPAKELQTDTLT